MKIPTSIPKWLEAAVFRNNRSRFSHLVLLSHYFDIRPKYRWGKRKLRKRISGTDLPMIGHLHVPKTGGNYVDSLQDVLPHLNFGHVVVRRNRTDKYCPVGLTAIDEEKTKGFFLFSLVRNPILFLVSYYYQSGGETRDYNNPKFHDHQLALRGFDVFVNTILNRTDRWPSRRFLYPTLFGQDGDCVVDWINRNEYLDADLQALGGHFALRLSARERKLVSPKVRTPAEHYSPELLQRVVETYGREMKLFGYDGFETVSPLLLLGPIDKKRLTYDYLADTLWLDGKIIERP
ncbi:MAG: hypothetical protein KAJ01_09930 [Candidatus Hydrogenedentes bacterium]|nr:hypothetical protein [Candidatus Hydrogenedentota bacterium]